MATPKKSALLEVTLDDLPKLALDYARYSTDNQSSTEEQVSINEELALESGMTIVAHFADEAISRDIDDRPDLDAMYAYFESHRDVKYLITNELQRLTAGVGQRDRLSRMQKRLDITVITADGVYAPHDEKKMQEADEASVKARAEVLLGRARTKRNLRAIVRTGKSVVMRPPYGVQMVPLVMEDGTVLPSGMAMINSAGKRIQSGRIELHPTEYPHLIQIFQWSAEGHSMGQIARWLNEAGVPTKTGRARWSAPTIKGILDNRFYIGEMVWGLQETRRDENNKKYTVVRRKGDPGRIDMKSPLGEIIDTATFVLAEQQRDLRANRMGSRERTSQPRQVLDGRVYCQRCGHKMYGRNQGNVVQRRDGYFRWAYGCASYRPQYAGVPGYERCTAKWSIGAATIFDGLAGIHSSEAGISVVRGVSGDGVKAAKDREWKIIEKAQADMDRYDELAMDGDINPAKLRARKQVAEAEIQDAENRIKRLGETREVVVEPITANDHDALRQLVELITDETIPLSLRVSRLDDFGLEKLYVDKPLTLRLQLR